METVKSFDQHEEIFTGGHCQFERIDCEHCTGTGNDLFLRCSKEKVRISKNHFREVCLDWEMDLGF